MQKPLKPFDRVILVLLSAVLVFASIDKLFHYKGFVNALRDYVLVPRGSAQLLAMPAILLELLLGLALWVPAWRRAAFFSSSFLFVVFAVLVGTNLLYGNRGVCGCWFSLTLASNNELHIVQNLLFASLAFMVGSDLRPKPMAGAAQPSLPPPSAE